MDRENDQWGGQKTSAGDGVIKSSGGDKPNLGAISSDDRGGGGGQQFAGDTRIKKTSGGDKKTSLAGMHFFTPVGGMQQTSDGDNPPYPPLQIAPWCQCVDRKKRFSIYATD